MTRKKYIKALTAGLLAGLILALSGCNTDSHESTDNKELAVMRYGDVYDFVNPDTGVHYLIYDRTTGYAGKGGITPRLNADGSIMVTETSSKQQGE